MTIFVDPLRASAEWLVESAPLALAQADAHCRRPPDPAPCHGQHGGWQYLRRLGLVAGPERHAAFFRDAIEAPARGGGLQRLLIAGCADHAMLAHVLAACDGAGAAPEITVVDRCQTPLFACRWFAEKLGRTVATEAADLLAYRSDDGFDLICTHGLSSRISVAERRDLVAGWRDQLTPAGCIVTTASLSGDGAAGDTHMPTEIIEAYRALAAAAAVEASPPLQLSAAEIDALAVAFIDRPRQRRFGSADEVRALFRGAGLTVRIFNRMRLPGHPPGNIAADGGRRIATYLEIVAVRS